MLYVMYINIVGGKVVVSIQADAMPAQEENHRIQVAGTHLLPQPSQFMPETLQRSLLVGERMDENMVIERRSLLPEASCKGLCVSSGETEIGELPGAVRRPRISPIPVATDACTQYIEISGG